MNSIVICEKSSQRRNILEAVGEKYGPVFAASGHLYALAEPEEYGDDFADWNSFKTLHPAVWKKTPTTHSDSNEQSRLDKLRREIAKALKNAKTVYIATDADREGEVIGREILDENGYQGRTFRVLFAQEDAETLREAFEKPIPIEEREAIYQAGLARERADFIWNLSLTRAATTSLVPKGSRGVIGIGRVKTPTHAIVTRRELQIKAFKPDSTFSIKVTIDTPQGPLALTVPKEAVFPSEDEAKAAAQKIADGKTLTLTVTKKAGRRAPPKPPSLSALQIIAGRWGWSADDTLATGQELYSTAKIMTYVRAAARFYPEAMISDVPAILAGLAQIPELAGTIPAEPAIRKGKGGFFSDAGLAGESHHALAPNIKKIAEIGVILSGLPDAQKRLFLEVARLFIQCVSPDEEFITHSFVGTASTEDAPPLTATGKVQTKAGWRGVNAGEEDEDSDDNTDSAAVFPESGTYTIVAAEPFKRASNPPPRYTQGTLIKAMLNAWRFIPDKERRDRLKEAKGIGTEATRANVITGLIEQGLLEDAKTLMPSQAGILLFTTLYEIDKRLIDPGTTADWENQIDEIARGNMSESAFVQAIADETGRLIEIIKRREPNVLFGKVEPPTAAMKKAVEAIARKGPKPPPGWKLSAEITRQFLDKHARPKAERPESGFRFPFVVPEGRENQAKEAGLKQDGAGWFADDMAIADRAKLPPYRFAQDREAETHVNLDIDLGL